MAIASFTVKPISRSSGRSSVAAAAYRSGETLTNEREGVTYSYARKSGIVYTAILLPENAPEQLSNRQVLWNEVERIEKASNARVAREIMIALPKELSSEQNISLARAYAQTFAHEGMVADLSIHDKGDGNPHAHILLTTRPLNENGTWGEKSRKEYMLSEQGEKIRLKSGEYKSRKVDLVDWNTEEKLVEWHKRYESITNYHLEKAGRPERICVDSYEEQGIEKIPTKHLGHYAHQLEQQGIPSVLGNINRQIEADNRQREAIDKELGQLQEARKAELAQLEEAQREAAKRHQRKSIRPQEEPSRQYARPGRPSEPEQEKPQPEKTFEERLAEKTRESQERRRRRREREREGHTH